MSKKRFFVVTYITKPDGSIDEMARIEHRINPNIYQTANVILDLDEGKVVKCRIGGEIGSKDWNTVFTHYEQYYKTMLTQPILV